MNKAAKILIASAFAVAVGIASADSWTNVAKNPATFAHQVGPHVNFTSAAPVPVRPPAPVQPTEWWALKYLEGPCENEDGSPASFYEILIDAGQKPHLTDNGTAVTIEWKDELDNSLTWYRSKAACEATLQATKDAALAKLPKLDQFLAPYR